MILSKNVDNLLLLFLVLGADRNKLNLLRRCQACSPRVEQRKPYLHKRRFRDFFVNFHEGKIQVGDMKNRELILEYKDPLPMRVRYIGFKSVSRVGSWKFYESKSGEKTLDNRIFFSPVVYIQTLFINMIGYQFFL